MKKEQHLAAIKLAARIEQLKLFQQYLTQFFEKGAGGNVFFVATIKVLEANAMQPIGIPIE